MQRNVLIFLSDFTSFWLALLLLIVARFHNETIGAVLEIHLFPFSILFVSWILTFYLFDLYDLFHIKPTIPHLRRFILALLFSLLIGVLFFYFIPIFGITPKTNLIIQLLLFGILSFTGRRIIYLIFSGQTMQPAILIGQTNYLSDLENAININPQTGVKVEGKSATLTEAVQKYSKLKRPLFIYESFSENTSNETIIELLRKEIEVIDAAETYERYFAKIPISYINSNWIIENIHNKKNVIHNLAVRARDVFVATFVLVITLPITLLVGLFIYLYDKENIFYTSGRTGQGGKVFSCYKFRSMYATIDKNPDADGTQAIWHIKNDTRVTPIGKIIRKLHIDEIPQMVNIIKGDMALVGPRPERCKFVNNFEKQIPNYGLRHIIRPGFTGWAQIKYRYAHNTDDTKEKFEYDLYYIKNRNFFLDLGIMLKTLQIIFTH